MAGSDTERVTVAELTPGDFAEAVAVLARGMRDNPMHVAAFGPDPERRERRLERLFGALFETISAQRPLCARRDASIVAVTGVAPPGACRPSPRQGLAMLPALVGGGPRSAVRAARWLRAWASRDPEEPHAHVGPLAVDRGLQGGGIGSVLLADLCRRLDGAGEVGYLETDKEENVRFYSRQNFGVVAEAEVLGVPNWFMRRRPRP